MEALLVKSYKDYERIIIVTESIFSMDGDVAPLDRLVDLKKRYPGVMLYVDEAHGIGVRGRSGLGVAEEQGCLKDIDFCAVRSVRRWLRSERMWCAVR